MLRGGSRLQAGRPALRGRRGGSRRAARGDRGRRAGRPARRPGARALGAPGAGAARPGHTTGIRRRALTLVGITGTNGKTTTSLAGRRAPARARAAHRRHRHDPVRGRRPRPARPIRRRPRRSSCRRCWPRCATPAVGARGDGGVVARAGAPPAWTARSSTSAVFTNLTQDHLDFHGSLEAYRGAKARLFELLAARQAARTAVVERRRSAPVPRWSRGLDLPRAGLRPERAAPSVAARRDASALDGIRMRVDDAARAGSRSARRSSASTTSMNLLGAVAAGLALGLRPGGDRRGARRRSARCPAASSG